MSIFSFFKQLDEKIWHGEMNTTEFLGTFSVLASACWGIVVASESLTDSFSSHQSSVSTTEIQIVTIPILLMLINIYESIIAAPSYVAAAIRSVIVVLLIGGVFVLGFAGVYVVVLVFVFYVFITMMLRIMLGDTGGSTIITSSGKKLTKKKELFNTDKYEDNEGHTYTDHGGYVSED